MKCRVCGGSDVREAFNLGNMPLANRLLTREQFDALPDAPEPKYPLALAVCVECSFVQLTHVVPPEVLYADYPYATGTSAELRQHFAGLATDVVHRAGVPRDGFALDVGSNDGTLLDGFRVLGLKVLGIEPAAALAERARAAGIPTWMEFFGDRTVRRILTKRQRCPDVVTATNVLTHVDDALGFLRNVRYLLLPRSVFAAEMYYLPSILASGTFDQVYHEHLSYFTAHTLLRLLQDDGLEAFHLEVVPVHGGSLRVYAGLPGQHLVRDTVRAVLDAERPYATSAARVMGLLEGLRGKAERTRWALQKFVDKVHFRDGKRIVGYGAAAKATTLLNYCRVGIESIEAVIDDNPMKQGRYLPGVHIPVVSPESVAFTSRPDVVLIFAWNLADEIAEKLAPLKERGTRLFVPFPKLREV